MTEYPTRVCKRCGVPWTQRMNLDRMPKQCPHCKSPKWNVEKLAKYNPAPSETPQQTKPPEPETASVLELAAAS